MAQFTPGPWEANEVGDYADFDGASRVITGDDMRICVVHAGGPNADENAANARLIAAAPALYAALTAMIEPWSGFTLAETERRCDPATFRNVIAARAALALAHPADAARLAAGGGA